jgi:SEC-C motif-containing protein
MNEPDCYCGSQKKYKDCCHPFMTGASKPETPEQLMRSRYTAFCVKDIEYLISTHHPSGRQDNEQDLLTNTIHETQWLGLKILKTDMDPDDTHTGFVEFTAFYKTQNTNGQLHERSKFIHEAGQWYYLDGEFMAPLVFGRNDPCWCGGNKKYKKCHGR